MHMQFCYTYTMAVLADDVGLNKHCLFFMSVQLGH